MTLFRPNGGLPGLLFCAVSACFGTGGTAAAQELNTDSLIGPTSIGPVSVDRSELDLIALLGPDIVQRADAEIGEGFCAPGSLVYPGSTDEIRIVWSDSSFTEPAEISVSRPGSSWRTAGGVGIGTTLRELEAIRGEPVSFSGFGWDYGGGASWSERELHVGLRLFPERASLQAASADPRYPEILGDRSVDSDHPLIRTMTIRVEWIGLSTRAPRSIEYECLGGRP